MELLFVYNAQNDILNGVVDYAHKVFKPSTYKCDLCALTHHNLGERKVWKEFKRRTSVEMSFLYIKQFEKQFVDEYEYPVVIRRKNGQNTIVLSREDFRELETVKNLIERLEEIIEKR